MAALESLVDRPAAELRALVASRQVSARELLCAFGEDGRQRLARLRLDDGRLETLALPYEELEGVRVDRARAERTR